MSSFDLDEAFKALLDKPFPETLSPITKPVAEPEKKNWPVTDSRWKVLETRGNWELYEFSVTKERNWCNIDEVKKHGVSHVFYDPDIDPMWAPPIPNEDEFKWGSFP